MRRMSALLTASILCTSFAAEPPQPTLVLRLRSRKETAKGSGTWNEVLADRQVPVGKTALIICDVWNEHWCKSATRRCAAMVPRMNEVAAALRRGGALIIHAPSDTMKFYENTPQRKRAIEAPPAKPPLPIGGWLSLDPAGEGPLPIDDSDGGCDDQPQCQNRIAWKSQHPGIEIAPEDAISESGTEVWNLLAQKGADTVIFLGVHTNMCVLGRPFGIRQMVRQGKNVVLIRDLTDTMYNPRKRPQVPHDKGTELVIEHVEKYWCPTITSEQVLGK
jgi:nicotinamidase-related amidase